MTVRLFRAFDLADFVAVPPFTVRLIAVLDRTRRQIANRVVFCREIERTLR
jgi:hypothetical protein